MSYMYVIMKNHSHRQQAQLILQMIREHNERKIDVNA